MGESPNVQRGYHELQLEQHDVLPSRWPRAPFSDQRAGPAQYRRLGLEFLLYVGFDIEWNRSAGPVLACGVELVGVEREALHQRRAFGFGECLLAAGEPGVRVSQLLGRKFARIRRRVANLRYPAH